MMRSLVLLTLAFSSAPETECFLSPAALLANRRESALAVEMFGGKVNFFGDADSDSDKPEEASGLSGWFQGARGRRRRRQGQSPMSAARIQRLEREQDRETRFLSGDDLQSLRQEVLDLRHELHTAPVGRKRELEQTILQAQQMDAEFIYQVATERAEAAEHAGMRQEALKYRQEAEHARAALPQFNLQGLWVGKYGDHGFEIINCTYQGDTLIATKVTGDQNVPKGEISFQVDLSPVGTKGVEPRSSFPGMDYFSNGASRQANDGELMHSFSYDAVPQPLEPIELNPEAAEQWGSRFLQRFQGMGHVASSGFRNAQWMEGQLIMVGTSYFSFAWLPLGHQVFFGRPSAELTLKLLKESEKKDDPLARDREHLNRCWEETQLLDDDMEVSDGLFASHDQEDYYNLEGCFE